MTTASFACAGWSLPTKGGRVAYMSTREAKRLGDYVKARRLELDLNQLEVWHAGGPSNTTQTAIENGHLESLQRSTARKIDAGLQWAKGSARAVWEGGEPTPLVPGLSSKDSRWLRERILEADLGPTEREALLRVIDAG